MGTFFSLKPSVVIERGSDVAEWGDTINLSLYSVASDDSLDKTVLLFIKVGRYDVLKALESVTSEVDVYSRHSDVYGCWLTTLRFTTGSSYFVINVHKDLKLDSMTVRESEDKFFDERMQLLERD